MSGIEIIACVAAVITAFQGAAELTRKIQTIKNKKKKEEARFLEHELQLALERGKDELSQHKLAFVAAVGYTVPCEEPFLPLVSQLYGIRSSVDAFYQLLQQLYDNSIPIPDPRKAREDAERWRFAAIQAMSELRMRTHQSGARSMPLSTSPPYPPSSYMQPPQHGYPQQHRPYHVSDSHPSYPFNVPTQPGYPHTPPQTIVQTQQPRPTPNAPPTVDTTLPGPPPTGSNVVPQVNSPSSRRSSRDSRDMQWIGNTGSPDTNRLSPQPTGPADGTWTVAPAWSPLDPTQQVARQFTDLSLSSSPLNEKDKSLRPSPPKASSATQLPSSSHHRLSVATSHASSSGSSSKDLAPFDFEKTRRSSSFLGRFSGSKSRRTSTNMPTIERKGSDVYHALPSAKNDWHGFCRGSFEIAGDNSSGFAIVQRPYNLHSMQRFLQCKRCAFPGHHCGESTRQRAIDQTIMVSAKGIRFRWIFLAKSHMKSKQSASGEIKVSEHITHARYGCVFCYREGKLPDTLGGLETLMNHIWQYHRGQNMSQRDLQLTGCILGRYAGQGEPFDINIPAYEEVVDVPEEQAVNGSVLIAGTVDLAVTGAGLGPSSVKEDETGVETSIKELSEMGRRGSPVEMEGSQSYVV
ncbi:hypothetical protein FH972_022247 [Carpinus fangiana]|uniref:Uncharacterized protein n=1 Tax=Carpinus fangiana TaxID=176857 RepID=A0A5N6KSB4_9ROSI|nr:hypothetical protein FH972_022247 [Carpinus fangiana]